MEYGASKKILKASQLDLLAAELKAGKVAAIPTDTVYGIAALMNNSKAIERIYSIKKRPKNKPLIIFVKDPHDVEDFVEELPPFGIELMERFWPGALTIIFAAGEGLPGGVTAGLDTIGVRMPDSKLVLEILRKVKVPLAVTSANISGKKDLTNAADVERELGVELDYILEGDIKESKGVSTIVDVTGDHPSIFRPGVIKKKQLEEIVPGISE
jgi:L-threonylcarbamoyladenylate synthase